MRRILSISSLFLIIMLCGQTCIAQRVDTATGNQDATAMIKQLVKEQLVLQLRKSGKRNQLQQNRLVDILKDTAVIDTLSKLVLQALKQAKNAGISSGKTLLVDAGRATRQSLQQHFDAAMQMKVLKDIFSKFTGILQQPLIAWKSGSINTTGQTAPSSFNGEAVFANSHSVNASLSVMGVPVSLQFTRQYFTGSEYGSRNSFFFQFDHEAYLNGLRDKIKRAVSAGDLLLAGDGALQQLRKEVLGKLSASLDSINAAYKGVLKKEVEQLGDPQNLLKVDLHVLQDKLLAADFLQDIENKKNQLAQLQQQLNTGEIINHSLYDSLTAAVQSVQGVQAIIDKIQSVKSKVQGDGLLEQLQQAAQSETGRLQQSLQDPDKLKTLAKQRLDLHGLQRLFLNMSRLQAGMNTISLSPLTLYQYVNNGFNAAFVSNKTYLFIMAGKQKEFGSLYDGRFSASSVLTAGNTTMGLRVGKGDLQNSHAHLSIFSYAEHQNSYHNNLVNVLPGKTVVFTFSSQLKLNESNYLNLELSKSAHRYDNQKNIDDTMPGGNRVSAQLPVPGNFMQQLAVTLQWNGTMKDKDLSYDIQITHIGKEYNNPGSLFLSSGTTAFRGSFKKSFLQNKLQIAARGNYRAYAYSVNNEQYRNYNFSFQAKWKLKKSQYIAFKYQPGQALKWNNGRKISMGGSSLFSLDMNLARRFGNIRYQHLVGLALLTNRYSYDTVQIISSSVLISSMQTFTVNQKSYYLSTQYNKTNAASSLAVFNTQFTCEAGFAYGIGKTITSSTAINYNSTKDWFQQLGIKQSLSGRLGEKCILSFYTAVQKNIKTYKPFNTDNIRLNWSLQYLLK